LGMLPTSKHSVLPPNTLIASKFKTKELAMSPKHLQPHEPEHPIRTKLKLALSDIDEAIDKLYQQKERDRFSYHSWSNKIDSAEKLLSHPDCRNKEAVQILLNMAILSYEETKTRMEESSKQWGVLSGYRLEISDALDTIPHSSPEGDELQHRLNILGAKTNVREIEGSLMGDDEGEILRSLQNTLFAAEALVSLQKEVA
jgi:hypothetical protein